MIVCAADNIAKMYGGHSVFQQLNAEIKERERIGLLGRNGSGKTTLLALLAGHETPDRGDIHWQKDSSTGYLQQIPEHEHHDTVEDVLKKPFRTLLDVQKRMRKIEERMAAMDGNDHDGTRLERILETYTQLQQQFEDQGGYALDANIRKVLHGLGIAEKELSLSFSSLSGGEKTRIGLASLLILKPDLLLLDEPTNYLDLKAIEWLEAFLQQYEGAVIIVSHDRYFLDRTVQKVWDLEDGLLQVYHGNYSAYVQEKEQRLLKEFQAYQDQQKKIKKMKEAIKRLKDWANRADNEDMHKKAKHMQKALDRMQKIKRPLLERRSIGLRFEQHSRSGQDVILLQQVGYTYAQEHGPLFEEVNMHIRYGQKAALIGDNGSGKSTLLKLVLGHFQPQSGTIRLGSNVKVGYLSQNGLNTDEDQTVLEAFRDQVPVTEGLARHILAKFLFYGPAVFRKTKALSGGEQMRLLLAQIMHQPINLLVLDEPTNHLDIDSREVLEEALAGFDGTVLAVSHDRYLLNRLFTNIYWLEDHTVSHYAGPYDAALRKRKQQANHKK